MANLPTITQDKMLEDIGLMTIENFYELEKVNTTLLKLHDIFTSVERTLRSSFELQKQDLEFRKIQQQDLERQQIEQSIEQQQPAFEPEQDLGEPERPRFGSALSGIFGKLLGGAAIGGLLFLFKDELKKLVETGIRTFFSLTGTRSKFTDEISKILADNAFVAAIAGAMVTPFLGPFKGALVAGVVLLGRTVADYIDKQFEEAGLPRGAGSIFEFSLYGATIGSFFGPKGILIGAIVGGVIGLGKALYNWFEGEKDRVKQEIDKSSLPQSRKDELGRAVDTSTVSTAASIAAANVGGGTRPSLPSIQAQIPPAAAAPTAPSISAPAGAGMSAEDRKLLDFVAAKESGGDYNMVFGQGSVPGLTDMTLKQVMDYQRELIRKGQKSSAVGKYQFVQAPLQEEIRAAQLNINTTKFSPEIQDRLILQRLKRMRGLEDYRSGKISQEQFAENLSKEFASLPSPIKGGGTKSYYEGDEVGNKALVPIGDVMGAITPPAPVSSAITPVGTTSTGAAVVGGTQATQIARDNMVINAPTVNNMPVNNVTNIATTQRKTIVAAQSPRMSDPTFMRVQELNYA